ncbi:MAG TPA: peptidylprolyl isomerase [Terracidiphilus sp.]|nr:peptidylprolyl isomerase [Terracidiphilus sp.]
MRTRPPIRLRITRQNTGCSTEENSGCPILAAASSRPGWDWTLSSRAPVFKSFLVSTLLYCLAAATVPAFSQAPQSSSPVVLDSVVAVVNRSVILASDIDDEIRLSVLDPGRAGQGVLTPKHALEQLISRALIEQQIHREDAQAAEPLPAEIDARLAEIRKELPACVHENCASDAGWKVFLAAHNLTPERVDTYLRSRLEILRFIEQRFRPGIHISPQDIETYYRNTLLPEYASGETVPSLEKVSPRIEEILLQQQVNVLFDEWLTNLRKQGDVEVLDPALETAATPASTETKPGAQISSPSAEGKGSQ